MLILIHAFQRNAIRVFTGSDQVIAACQQVWPMILAFLAQDYIQGVLCGVIKALGQQRRAIYVNFGTYEIIAIPLCYFLTFKVGQHVEAVGGSGTEQEDAPEKRDGMGLVGLWSAFAASMLH